MILTSDFGNPQASRHLRNTAPAYPMNELTKIIVQSNSLSVFPVFLKIYI